MDAQLGPITSRDSMADSRFHHFCQHHQREPSHDGRPPLAPAMRKRKAQPQENERLSKRLSLLHLEKNGHRLYLPIRCPSSQRIPEDDQSVQTPPLPAETDAASAPAADDDDMRLDDTKHKVYIYDLDAELSSADECSDGESSPTSGQGRVIFLPDIEKHFCKPRIPPAVLANRDGQLAGHSIDDMQMVLYNEPSSISVPPEHDSVRKAILEARARMREKQSATHAGIEHDQPPTTTMRDLNTDSGVHAMENGFIPATDNWCDAPAAYYDVDAMDTD